MVQSFNQIEKEREGRMNEWMDGSSSVGYDQNAIFAQIENLNWNFQLKNWFIYDDKIQNNIWIFYSVKVFLLCQISSEWNFFSFVRMEKFWNSNIMMMRYFEKWKMEKIKLVDIDKNLCGWML